MTETEKKICPKCGKEYTDEPAISREDDKTEICTQCGKEEADVIWMEHLIKTASHKD